MLNMVLWGIGEIVVLKKGISRIGEDLVIIG